MRSVEGILAPPAPHMVGDGFRVHNFLPGNLGYYRMSPFIMMDYNSKVDFPGTETPRGVGVHPHRGFETVTLAYQGAVAHHDSAGNSGVIRKGDVQWMTAGSGILHKEYHEKDFARKGGEFQMVQLWVNLPAAQKMTPPRYQGLENKDIPKTDLGGGSRVEVVAGEFKGLKGAAQTFTPVHLFNAYLAKGGSAEFEFPATYNTAVLVIEGHASVNGHDLPADHLALLGHDGEKFIIEASEKSILLILSGEPINETLVPYGPFVMNTREQIMQAFDDLNHGKFGTLED